MKKQKLYQVIYESNGTIVHSSESGKKPNLNDYNTAIGVYVQEIEVSAEPIRFEIDRWGELSPIFQYNRIGTPTFKSVSDFK